MDVENPRIRGRSGVWRAWEDVGFKDEAIAARIASEADVMVGPIGIASASWTRLAEIGSYAVYAAARPAGAARLPE